MFDFKSLENIAGIALVICDSNLSKKILLREALDKNIRVHDAESLTRPELNKLHLEAIRVKKTILVCTEEKPKYDRPIAAWVSIAGLRAMRIAEWVGIFEGDKISVKKDNTKITILDWQELLGILEGSKK